MRLSRQILLTLAIGTVASIPSVAATIDLGINGDAQVGANFIYFSSNYPTNTAFAPAPTSATTVTAANYGIVQVAQVSGSLPGVTSGEMAGIQSLSTAIETTKAAGDFTNVYTPGAPFLVFAAGGSNQEFFLTDLVQGTFAPGSPFTFTSTPNGLVASFNVDGYLLNTTTNARTNYTGTFSATFNSVMDPGTLATLLPLQTPFSATFSLTQTNITPEPTSMLLMGVGLLAAGLVTRRKIGG